jgi:hypothetical protein
MFDFVLSYGIQLESYNIFRAWALASWRSRGCHTRRSLERYRGYCYACPCQVKSYPDLSAHMTEIVRRLAVLNVTRRLGTPARAAIKHTRCTRRRESLVRCVPCPICDVRKLGRRLRVAVLPSKHDVGVCSFSMVSTCDLLHAMQ